MATHAAASEGSLTKPGTPYRSRSPMFPSRSPRPQATMCERSVNARSAAAAERERALEQKVLALMPIVNRVAATMRKHLPAHVELDDLVGEGMLGLIDAARKFDAHKNVKIENYAQYRIRGAILDGLRGLDNASRDLRRKSKEVEKVHRRLEMKLGRPVEDEEVAEAMGVSLKGFHRTLGELQAVGLDWLRTMPPAGVKQPTEETLPATGQDNQIELCYRREQMDMLRSALARLPERERTVVLLYDFKAMTMKDIGAKLMVDESRVSQLHSTALARLRSMVKAMLRPPVTPPYSLRPSDPSPDWQTHSSPQPLPV